MALKENEMREKIAKHALEIKNKVAAKEVLNKSAGEGKCIKEQRQDMSTQSKDHEQKASEAIVSSIIMSYFSYI